MSAATTELRHATNSIFNYMADIAVEGRLRFYRTKEAVIVARTPESVHKLARFTFGRDGSIYVQFPYLDRKVGVIAELPVDPKVPGPVQYNLRELGERVGTDVKFSHHASGEVRFSKTGQVIKTPLRQSFHLGGPIGRVFELSAFHLHGFHKLGKRSKNTVFLGFNFREGVEGVRIRAEWRRKTGIVANIEPAGSMTGPATTALHRETRVEEAVYFVGPPLDRPHQQHVLMVSSSRVGLPDGADQPSMVFLGGWDPHERTADEPPQKLGNCLAFLYPIKDE